MGIPKFFRYISERYPCINELVREYQIPDFDNLYLDMNGIIHCCSHPNESDAYFSITDEKIYSNIFYYIEFLFNMIRPRKLFFMAVDGVAPRAKLNQQRARRFKTAKEAEALKKKLLEEGKQLPEIERFDSNCITPGTVFMDNLNAQLMYFVAKKISTDPLWQNCKIIFSGHQTPGEGEHKIMDYIRYLKTLPDYDPNTKHCLYGLDADLITLGLCTHEPHFSLLREKVQFKRKETKRIVSPAETEFYLLHLSLFREYLDLEFQELKEKLSFEYDLEKIIDDWVLMGFLVGNDFIPNLPDMHITEGALPVLYKAYKAVRPELDGYLNENGYLNLPRFQKYLDELSKHDLEIFEETYAILGYAEEKFGKNLPENEPSLETSKKSDLEDLIKSTNELFLDSNEEGIEDENDTFLYEFGEHKKNYYKNKLEYKVVDEEVLRSQAEGYIRAIQWNLFYYYLGCQSWSWYYPHHYSPYISDVTNFKDLKLEFEMGQPFLPFEQLLAVLPPASCQLLPPPYRELMTSPNSPIIDFYPKEFETDLNGKQQEWEAVVLIPFIDEKKILKAMEPFNNQLTKEERLRNRHTAMYVYTYSSQDLGPLKGNFPTLKENHALMEEVHLSQVLVDKSCLKFGLQPGVLLDIYYPGFPTLKHIPHTASLQPCKVKVFEFPSKSDSVLIKINAKETPPIKDLAPTLLGKTVLINWPHLTESKVLGVSDGKIKYSLGNNDKPVEEILDEQGRTRWLGCRNSITMHHFDKLAIDIGSTDVLVYVAVLEGCQHSFEKAQTISKKIWSDLITPYPFQLMLKDIKISNKINSITTIEDAFPVGSTVFMLGQPYFGSIGKVLENSEINKNGRLKVAIERVDDFCINESCLKSFNKQISYFPCNIAAQKVGMSPRLLSRITGCIFVESDSDDKKKINIGLDLKYNRKNEELPEYTKKENDVWLYSINAIKLVTNYVQRFPRILERVADSSKSHLTIEDLFPNSADAQELQEIVEWIKQQDFQKIERIKCGSQVLNLETISEIEKILENCIIKSSTINMQVKPHLLYKSDLIMGNLPPQKSVRHQLLDRVVCVKSTYSVPIGLRGYIIGIHKDSSDSDNVYDIIFDKPFTGGMKLYTSKERCFKMSRLSFINITDANRMYQSKTINRSVQDTMPKNQLKYSSLRSPQNEPNISAFAQWNQMPSKPISEKNEDQFKKLWSNLQTVKPPQQTDVLKKILKIDEQKEARVEDPIKTFFEKASQLSNAPIPKEPVNKSDASLNNFPQKSSNEGRTRYSIHLYYYCQTNFLSPPIYNYMYLGNKVMAQAIFPNGKVYTGLPCDEKHSACESASLQALAAVGAILTSTEPLIPSYTGSKIKESQAKLASALLRGGDEEIFLKDNDKSKELSHSKVNVGSSNVAHFLPNPPPQWVGFNKSRKQRNNSCNPSEGNQLKQSENYSKPSNQKTSSALEFVPLQAITGVRNRGVHPITQVSNNVPVKPHSEVQKKPDKVNIIAQSGPSSTAPTPSNTVRRNRRPKIAANLALDPNLY